MKTTDVKTMSYIAACAGIVGIILSITGTVLTSGNTHKAIVMIATFLMTASITLYIVLAMNSQKEKEDAVKTQGDFNTEARKAAPGATDAQYTCASNMVTSSVKDLFSLPELNKVYNLAVAQSKTGSDCDEASLVTAIKTALIPLIPPSIFPAGNREGAII